MVPGEKLWHADLMKELHRTVRLLYTGKSQRALQADDLRAVL